MLYWLIFLLPGLALMLVAAYKYYYRQKIYFFKDTSTQQRASFSEASINSRTMVALTFGQSNAANHSNWKYSSKQNVFNYFQGNFYKAQDPLLGASADGGSVWCYFSDLIIERGFYDTVILIPIAIGDTSVDLWGSGKCNRLLKKTLSTLDRDGISVTYFLYHQGESDNSNNTSNKDYKKELSKILKTIRRFTQRAPLFVSIATYNGGINTELQNAQMEFIAENIAVYRGPNTDLIIEQGDRYDGIHFSETGVRKAAEAWVEAICKKSK